MHFLIEKMPWNAQGLRRKAWGALAAISSILIVTPSQAQVTEAEMAEIEQFYLDAYAIKTLPFRPMETLQQITQRSLSNVYSRSTH